MKRYIFVLLFLTVLWFLTGCASSNQTIPGEKTTYTLTPQIPATLTATATVTSTALPTQTLTPTIAPTQTPTFTPSPTPTRFGGYPDQYLVSLRGPDKNIVNLYDENGSLANAFFEYSFDPNLRFINHVEIKISPKGDRVCILYGKDGKTYLTLFKADGTEIVTLETRLTFYGGRFGQANWSQDGNWLVFTSKGEKSTVDIYLMDKNGENLKQLTNTYEVDSGPYFLPSGDRIIHSGGKMIALDGTFIQFIENATSWTKDGKKYIYSSSAQRVGLASVETNEKIKIYSTPHKDLYISDAEFSAFDNWVLISVYDSTGQTIQRGYYNWYKLNMNDLTQLEWIATSPSLILSPDQSVYIFSGWLSSESIFGDPKRYAIDAHDLDINKAILLSEQAESLFFGHWLPGSTSTTPGDPKNYLGPTPIPAWEAMPEPPVYDQFEASNLDNKLWQAPSAADSANFQWGIWEGEFNIKSLPAGKHSGLDLFFTSTHRSTEISTFETKMKLWGGTFGNAFQKIQLNATIDNNEWWTLCKLGVIKHDPTFVCEVYSNLDGEVQKEYMTREIPALRNAWHTVRIELSPIFGALQFYFDGALISTYLPKHANDLIRGVELRPMIGVLNLDGGIDASFDDVRIGR